MGRSRKRKRNGKSKKASSSSSSSSSRSSSSSSSTDRDERQRRKRSKKQRKESQTVSQNVVLSSVIPEFDPLVDNVDMWLNVVEANARAFGWRDNMIKYQALQKLRNTAKTWLDSLQKNKTSWTTWKWTQWRNVLSDTFQAKRNMFGLLKEIIDAKPLPNQSLYEFFFAQKGKIDRLGLDFHEGDIISIIVGSIGDPNISTAAEAGNFKYCEDLASFLHGKKYSLTEKSVLQKNILVNKQHASRFAHSMQTGIESKPDYPKFEVPTNSSKGPNNTCYRCGEIGHRRNTCTVKDSVRCASCNRLGHLEAACRSKQNRAAPKTEKDAEVQMISEYNKSSKQKFYKKVFINEFECEAFFDMGSDCSLITADLVKVHKLKPSDLEAPTNLVGFTSDSSIQVTKTVTVNIKVDSVELTITLFVIDALSGCNLLIGRNFTEDRSIMYARVGDMLTFQSVDSFNILKIESSNEIDSEHKKLLNSIFLKYPLCISQDFSSLRKTDRVELDIELTSDKAVCQRPYRMSESEKVITREITDELLKNGIIRNSNSPYASPALLVDKASGAKRLCIDYRQLNKITVKEKYPMPLIEDLVDRLRGCKYYTSLDLKSGYHQIPIKEHSIPKTAFITPDGHFEFTRMPFGLCNGPAVFQRLMDTVLGSLRFGKVICYMDDLLIATETFEENVACLEKVLDIFENNGLTINLDKCSFFKTEVLFLGYTISESGVRPSSRKLKAIEQFPSPTNIHQLRQFLGLVNYFRKFIRNCALLGKPLTKLLKKGIDWQWGPQEEEAVGNLKRALLDNAVLHIFDPRLPINLYADASRDGIGCILAQTTENGEKPVYFYSRQTSKEEKNYHSFELELLAIVTGLQKFRHYLLGMKFKVITDCNAVRHALTKREIIPRISRWVLLTQEFTFQVEHRPGTQMQHVDALSRNPIESDNASTELNIIMSITEGDWLLSVQLQDPGICSIREILLSGEADQHRKIFNEYELVGNKVYRRTEYGRRWLVPKECIWQIIRCNHDDVGHFAVDKTLERIKSKFWFPRLKKTVSKYIKNCLNCIYNKCAHGKKPGFLHPIPKYARPFHTLHLDHLGPFVKTTQQNNYLLVIVDSFTKFVFISAVKSTKSKIVINELNKIFKVFGNPKRLICDAGSAFTSSLFKGFCKDRDIRLHIVATAVPRSNGQVERYNKTVLDALRSMGADKDNNKWDQNVASIQQGINSTVNKTTSAVPSEVFFGYRIRMNNDKITDDDDIQHSVDVTSLRHTVDENIKKGAIRQKTYFDLKRKPAPNFKLGDLVVIRIPSHSNEGQSTKLLPLFKGPFQVVEVLGHDRYRVTDMRGAERSVKRYNGIACVENMKPWIHIAEDSQQGTVEPDVVQEIEGNTNYLIKRKLL